MNRVTKSIITFNQYILFTYLNHICLRANVSLKICLRKEKMEENEKEKNKMFTLDFQPLIFWLIEQHTNLIAP